MNLREIEGSMTAVGERRMRGGRDVNTVLAYEFYK